MNIANMNSISVALPDPELLFSEIAPTKPMDPTNDVTAATLAAIRKKFRPASERQPPANAQSGCKSLNDAHPASPLRKWW
jgi:hypothetical protein